MLARRPEDIGLLIRDRRLELGLDQRTLAERARVSRQWIVELEKGKPRAELGLILRTLAALELALDISPLRQRAAPAHGAKRASARARDAEPAPHAARSRARIDLDQIIERARGKKT